MIHVINYKVGGEEEVGSVREEQQQQRLLLQRLLQLSPFTPDASAFDQDSTLAPTLSIQEYTAQEVNVNRGKRGKKKKKEEEETRTGH